MGFFSWKTSDTKRSIPNIHSGRKTFKVHMITRDGQIFTEENYDGYGVFGGKDFYGLVAELNGGKDRSDGIGIAIGISAITNGKKTFKAGGRDFFNWEDDKLPGENKSANELLEEGWESIKIFKENTVLPKFVKKLPPKKTWEQSFDALPESKDCPDQGFFYGGI